MARLNVILDSGAFTAWNSGKPIDLMAYCRFLKENEHWITSYASLDVIDPGRPEEAAAASLANYKIMRGQGLRPMPIFHVGENVRWLQQMLDMGADYIGLSASSLVGRAHVDHWYNTIWHHLCDSAGRPMVRCNALGEGRVGTLKAAPWYSADTATWIYTAMRTGNIHLDGTKARVAHRNDGVSSRAAPDIDSLAGADKAAWQALLLRHGVSQAAFSRDMVGHTIRMYLLAKHYLDFERQVNAACPLRLRTNGFLCQPLTDLPALAIPDFRLHLVIGNNCIAAAVVAATGVQNVLISFAHLYQNKGFPQFGQFVEDPMGTVLSQPKYLKHYNRIKDHIPHAG